MRAARQFWLVTFLRRGIAAGCAALVLVLAVLSVCPRLHQQLHDNTPLGPEDHCAITVFATGASAPPPPVTVPPPPEPVRAAGPVIAATECFVESPRYLILPERGPPAA